MSRKATGDDLLRILRNHAVELQRKLGLEEAQFSVPTDGAGLRIKVAVRDAKKGRVPNQIDFRLDNDSITVPLELSEDYQDYKRL